MGDTHRGVGLCVRDGRANTGLAQPGSIKRLGSIGGCEKKGLGWLGAVRG